MKLTARQQQVLDFIVDYTNQHQMPPTRKEIAAALGFKSPNAAEEHVKALARKGAIEMVPGASRGIRIPDQLLNEAANDDGLPVIGRVAAGSPVLATEHIAEHIKIPADMFYPKADYMLRVQGMSMKDIGILEDDLVAVHKTENVRNGDVIVARINDDVTIKTFHKKGSKITLIAENEDFNDIEVDPASDHFSVEGLYVGVIRTVQ